MTSTGIKRKQMCTVLSVEEKHKFTWKYETSQEIMKTATNDELWDEGYVFEAGENIGLPTSWKVFVQKDEDDENEIYIYMELLKTPEEFPKVKATWGYQMLNDSTHSNESTETFEFTTEENTFRHWNVFSLDEFEDEDDLDDGNLEIHITFCLFKDDLQSGTNKRMKFEQDFRHTAAADFQKFLDSGEDADVTFEIRDGQTLKAHRAFLKARSRVFSTMLCNQMQESSTGVIRIEDVSYEAMKIILSFLYTGTLDNKWKEVVSEIVYASDKYGFHQLKKFCDENLASTCTPANAWSLMDLAKEHGLKTAQGEIGDYVKEHIAEIVQAKISS